MDWHGTWQKLGIAGVALVSAGFGAVGAHAAGDSPWSWIKGDERAFVAGAADEDDLELYAARNLNLTANHIRIVGRDGNFELEHDRKVPVSTINAYVAGTGTRTPVQVGGWDSQDIVSLIVGGATGQKSALQSWKAGGKEVAAIDSSGRLSLQGVVLSVEVVSGKAVLVATLPNGTRQVLATGNGGSTVPVRSSASAAAGTKAQARPAASGGSAAAKG